MGGIDVWMGGIPSVPDEVSVEVPESDDVRFIDDAMPPEVDSSLDVFRQAVDNSSAGKYWDIILAQ